MSATATASPVRSRAVSVARGLGRVHRQALLLAAVIFGLIFAAVGVVLGLVLDDVTVSAWDYASYGPKYYLMSIGAILPALGLPAHVRAGVTRREFAVGGALFLGLVAVAAAAVMAAGYLVEALVYDAVGWTQGLSIPHLYTTPTQVPLVVVEFTLVFAAHLVSGWLIGTGFARLRGWGVLTLIPGLVPALAVDVALQAGWVGAVLDSLGAPPSRLPVALLVGVLVVAGGLAVTWLATRRMPVRVR